MKKYLYSLLFATLILISTPVVKAANEVYYTNKNNIEMTEKEYNNLLALGFKESYISRMKEDEFLANKDIEATLLSTSKKYIRTTTTMRNGIRLVTSKEITREEALEELSLRSKENPNRGPSGSFYDGMVANSVFEMTASIAAIGNTYMRFMNNVEWLEEPTYKYNDVIGIGIEDNKVQLATYAVFDQEWDTTLGVHDYSELCNPKYESTGGLAIFKLPDDPVQHIDIAFYFNVMKKPNVGTITSLYAVGDYAHAISNVSATTLLSYISITDTYGLMISAPYSTYYLSSPEAVASFIGTW